MRSAAWMMGMVAFSASLCANRSALAWDDFGHMEVAAVAYKNLKPAARKRALALLKLNPRYTNWILGASSNDKDRVAFMRAATWADAIKSDPQYTSKNDDQTLPTAGQNLGYVDKLRHAYWHFADQPFSPDGTTLIATPSPNVSTQIAAFRATLASADASDDVKSYDLTWLLHLVGDVHQPLHCVSRFDKADPTGDRGGNNVKITGNSLPPICDDPRYCPFDPASELHAFYDDIAGAGYGTAKVETDMRTLPKPDPQQAAVLDEGVWLKEGLDLAQSAVYVGPIGIGDGPFTVDVGYQDGAVALGKQRIALAGMRLAAVLNDCFAKEAAAKQSK
jgi:S1/P1 Nuclease